MRSAAEKIMQVNFTQYIKKKTSQSSFIFVLKWDLSGDAIHETSKRYGHHTETNTAAQTRAAARAYMHILEVSNCIKGTFYT